MPVVKYHLMYLLQWKDGLGKASGTQCNMAQSPGMFQTLP